MELKDITPEHVGRYLHVTATWEGTVEAVTDNTVTVLPLDKVCKRTLSKEPHGVTTSVRLGPVPLPTAEYSRVLVQPYGEGGAIVPALLLPGFASLEDEPWLVRGWGWHRPEWVQRHAVSVERDGANA